MADRVIDVDTGGAGDYSSLNLAEDAEDDTGDLVSNGDTITFQCRASGDAADTTAVTFTGWTTGAANYIQVEAASGDEAVVDGYKTDRYRLELTDATCLESREDYFRLDGIQVKATETSTGNAKGILIQLQGASNDVRITNSRVEGACTGTGSGEGISGNDADLNLTIENTVVRGFKSGADTGFYGIRIVSATCKIYNSVVEGNYYGIRDSSTAVDVVNSAVFNNDDDFFLTFSSITYTASDDGDGTTGVIDWTAEATDWDLNFADYSTGDFTLLRTGDIWNAGVGENQDASVPDTSMGGNSRGTGDTCDIGVDELTTINVYVDKDSAAGTPDGRSLATAYASLNLAEDAEDATGDLAALAHQLNFICTASSDNADTTAVTITGWTTSATYWLGVEAASGDEAVVDGYKTDRYRIEATDAAGCIRIEENYVRVDGIQIECTVTGTGYGIYADSASLDAANSIQIKNCRITGVCSGTGLGIGIYGIDTDGIWVIENTIVENFTSATDTGFNGINLNCASATIYNTVVYDCYRGIRDQAGSAITVKNSAVFGSGDDFVGTFVSITYTARDDADAGTGNVDLNENASSEWTNAVENYTTGDFTPSASGALEDNGIGPTGDEDVPTPDIAGTARSGASCDIGVAEIVSGAQSGDASLVTATATVYEATASGTGTAPRDAGLVTATATVYDATVAASGVAPRDAGLVDATAIVYSPTGVHVGNQSATAYLVTATATVYEPTAALSSISRSKLYRSIYPDDIPPPLQQYKSWAQVQKDNMAVEYEALRLDIMKREDDDILNLIMEAVNSGVLNGEPQ